MYIMVNNLYQFILFNLSKLSVDTLNSLLNELELQTNALYLKDKFKDRRSIKQLTELIKEEYSLT